MRNEVIAIQKFTELSQALNHHVIDRMSFRRQHVLRKNGDLQAIDQPKVAIVCVNFSTQHLEKRRFTRTIATNESDLFAGLKDQGRTVQKTYWACVEGVPQDDAGCWQDTMRKVPGEARSEIVPADHPDAQKAVLHFQVIERQEQGSWLEIQLQTGRTHQIRLQCACRGLPIIGDRQYGSTRSFGPADDDDRRRWIALHARRLAFKHPMTREQVDITAPLSVYWNSLGLALQKRTVDG